jgi:hypothetical protein
MSKSPAGMHVGHWFSSERSCETVAGFGLLLFAELSKNVPIHMVASVRLYKSAISSGKLVESA